MEDIFGRVAKPRPPEGGHSGNAKLERTFMTCRVKPERSWPTTLKRTFMTCHVKKDIHNLPRWKERSWLATLMGIDDLVRLCRRFQNKPTNEIFWNLIAYIAVRTLCHWITNSLLLLGKNVRGSLLRNHSFAKGADSSEWLRVNVVWTEGSIKYREIPLC